MLALSLATLPALLLQIVASPSPEQASLIDAFDLAVVTIFAADYAAGIWTAPVKTVYARAPANLLSMAIILLALGGAALSIPLLLSAPILRLLRVFRFYGEAGNASVEASTSLH